MTNYGVVVGADLSTTLRRWIIMHHPLVISYLFWIIFLESLEFILESILVYANSLLFKIQQNCVMEKMKASPCITVHVCPSQVSKTKVLRERSIISKHKIIREDYYWLIVQASVDIWYIDLGWLLPRF